MCNPSSYFSNRRRLGLVGRNKLPPNLQKTTSSTSSKLTQNIFGGLIRQSLLRETTQPQNGCTNTTTTPLGSSEIGDVSSLSAFLPPHAGGTLYYPVKSYLAQFSLALRAEMKADGINVTALCPGFTRTGFQDAAGGTVES